MLVYIFSLVIALVGLFYGLTLLPHENAPRVIDLLFWGSLLIWSSRISIQLPFFASISHSFVIHLASVVLFPAWIPPILAAVFRYKKLDEFNPWYKDLFNRLQFGLSAGLSALAWHLLSALSLGGIASLIPMIGASLVYFIANVSLVVYAIHLSSNVAIRKIWATNVSWLSASYLLLAPIALFLASAYTKPLVGDWGGFTVLVFMVLLYFSRFYWDEKVKLEDSFNATIDTLVQALDAKDTFTRLHSERVSAISVDLAKAKGLDEADRRKIAYGARIHDIGKVGIPDDVLLKPVRLTSQEFELIKSHTTRGVEILKPAARYFKEVLPIVLYHHERWDGRGYPEGRAGDAIPLWARIVCIADAYEAMTAGRSYSSPKSPERAMQELEDLAGDQFDPELVKLFKEIWLQDPIWKDREVFLRSYTSPVPLSELPSLSRSESASVTSKELS
ncbi:HD-GYP domain-containing protein [Calidithermus timidus]|uniref:HD-GYP domain-containing protein n=1 Tax=Calidithermus timidus TaxID=307124 RepID=UPI001FE0A188|nr:HD-GYP domain-containing protein [Calidithermus timidus]